MRDRLKRKIRLIKTQLRTRIVLPEVRLRSTHDRPSVDNDVYAQRLALDIFSSAF